MEIELEKPHSFYFKIERSINNYSVNYTFRGKLEMYYIFIYKIEYIDYINFADYLNQKIINNKKITVEDWIILNKKILEKEKVKEKRGIDFQLTTERVLKDLKDTIVKKEIAGWGYHVIKEIFLEALEKELLEEDLELYLLL
jgi:hypothetical protein